jgi:hypothetical protein
LGRAHAASYRLEEFDAIEIWHGDIGEDQVASLAEKRADRFDGIGRTSHVVLARTEVACEQRPLQRLVFDNQNS